MHQKVKKKDVMLKTAIAIYLWRRSRGRGDRGKVEKGDTGETGDTGDTGENRDTVLTGSTVLRHEIKPKKGEISDVR